MHTDDREALNYARVALAHAQDATVIARLAVQGIAYNADRHGDLELVHQAQEAAHKATLAAATLGAAGGALEAAVTSRALASSRIRTNAERRSALPPLDDPGRC